MQAIPELAKVVGHLYVFQRTPSTIDVRDQRATTDEEIETWRNEPGWARARRARFAKIAQGRTAIKANDDYLAGKVADYRERKEHATRLSPEELMSKQLDTNFRIMEQIRARVDAIVEDPKTAAALKPYYPYGCKRPTFHDEYLPTFNRPNVTLVDTAPMGVQEINERGVVHDGVEYPLDILIYATGFQWMATSTFNMVVGRGGQTLSEKWQIGGHQDVPRPALGGLPQPVHRHRAAGWRRQLQLHRRDRQPRRLRGVDAVGDARPRRADRRRQEGDGGAVRRALPRGRHRHRALRDCISYYNGHGDATPGSLAYYGGGQWHKWRASAQDSMDPYVFGRA